MAAVLQVTPPLMEEKEIISRIPQPLTTFGYVPLPETGRIVGTGWLPSVPDMRDYTDEHPDIVEMVEKLGITKTKKLKGPLPTTMDLRPWCSEISDQGQLGSCTAHAGVGIVEYYENRAFGKHIDGSRLFVYKTTRELLGMAGDTGADLRTTMAALVLFGVPLEKYWPYTTQLHPTTANLRTFDTEPTTFVYEIADNFQGTYYFCHDPWAQRVPSPDVLNSVKAFLAAGKPAMFGFYVFPSFSESNVKGGIPYPAKTERAVAGHAVVAIGYNDTLKIKNTITNKETTGALLIRNSWGKLWGDQGYGWLPYDYVTSQFAWDFWTLLGMKWVDTGAFHL